jgi:hypothetical protein
VKIQTVEINRRRRMFEVGTRRGTFEFPFAVATPTPSVDDNVVEAFVDPELGREGFTYRLTSGEEGSVHMDSVLEYNNDAGYLADLALSQLTTQVRELYAASGLSARVIAKRLGTSPAQLYRLLDPTNYAKSARQLLAVLYALGYELDIGIRRAG